MKMKEIRMDFETYEEELSYEHLSGKECGISLVMQWLESDERLYEFLESEEPINPLTHWGRIAIALGFENELNALETDDEKSE
jgi:hypothetical protein